jgi:hypothetical protein
MADSESSITRRVQRVETGIREIQAELTQLLPKVDTDPNFVIRALETLQIRIQRLKTNLAEIRNLITYPV